VRSFRDQKVLITGATRGLGKLIAEAFASEGASVVLWGRNAAALEAVAKPITERGRQCAAYVCDVADREQVYDTAHRVIREHAPIDILINSAGVVSGKPLLEIPDEAIEQTFAVNSLALFWTTRAFLPAMIERGHGHIVTIASASGLIGTPFLTDYAASKHAAVGFDDALRCELRHLGHRNIRTTVACTYYISTGMFDGAAAATPLFPILTPEYATRRIVEAIRRGRRRLLLPGTVFAVYPIRLLPTRVFDWVARVLGVTKSMDGFKGRGSA
jgi:all-trans-retinol dehydrogenase (NAD+)